MTPHSQAAMGPPELAGALPHELELVLLRFRLRAQRRAAWLRQAWSTDADLFEADAPAAEAAWIASEEAVNWNRQVAAAEEALETHDQSRLVRLCRIFGIDSQEFDLLQACLAVSLDPALCRVCAMLHGDSARPFVTADLAARLYGHGRCAHWNPESPLVRWQLLERHETGPGEPAALTIDLGIREWLRGQDNLDRALVDVARLHPTRTPFEHWPVESTVIWLKAQLRPTAARPVRLRIVGQRGSGRRTFAAIVSARLGMPMLAIRADEIEPAAWADTFVRAQRHGFLQSCALAWVGDSLSRRPWPQAVVPFPLQFVISESRLDVAPAESGELRIELPAARIEDRVAAWRQYAPPGWSESDVHGLACQYRVQVGDIAHACGSAPTDAAEAGLRVRESARSGLGSLAQLLPCTFTWDDLVVSESIHDALVDLLFEAQHRTGFWEDSEAQRLFPQGRGLLALFNGLPGTGKTMAAQVIAGALEYDLLRIDLSAVVSKYVGETSQNLERILSRAAHMDAVLLFDEADGLFGRRATEVKEAQDKFANTEAAYLLQAIEAYPGIAILASNQKGSIDNAFLRRIRFLVEFPKPDAEHRLIIWRRITSSLAGMEVAAALDSGLERLAVHIDATGAQIKNTVLGAVFIARRMDTPVAMPHLLRALERELAKEGRSLSMKEKERVGGGETHGR